jgi:hypothetical protein
MEENMRALWNSFRTGVADGDIEAFAFDVLHLTGG